MVGQIKERGVPNGDTPRKKKLTSLFLQATKTQLSNQSLKMILDQLDADNSAYLSLIFFFKLTKASL